MAQIKVTASQLKSKANSLRQLNNSFKTQITQLEGAESRLNSMWDGEANDAFHKAFMHDKQAMQEFKKAIDKYVEALNDIARKYEDAERKNTSTATARKY